MRCAREVMEILEAYDLTRCAHSAALLVGCDEKTVTRYVAVRDAGRDVGEWERRSRMIDPFLSKIEELVEASQGRIRADVVHEKLTAMGFSGTDRTTRPRCRRGEDGVSGRAPAKVQALGVLTEVTTAPGVSVTG